MPVFADFLDLRTAVVEYIGTESFLDVFPRLVASAEMNINRRLRLQSMISTATLTFSSGVASLPSDYVEAIGLYDAQGREYVQQPPQAVRTSDTTEQFYAVVGGEARMSGATGTKVLEYYAGIPAWTGNLSVSTGLGLTDFPNLYLYAIALEAAKYIKNVDMAQATMQILEMEYAALKSADDSKRFSRARVRVAGVNP